MVKSTEMQFYEEYLKIAFWSQISVSVIGIAFFLTGDFFKDKSQISVSVIGFETWAFKKLPSF